jgi:regulator of replication initiation timing
MNNITFSQEDVDFMKKVFNHLESDNKKLQAENDDLRLENMELKASLEPKPIDKEIDLSGFRAMFLGKNDLIEEVN